MNNLDPRQVINESAMTRLQIMVVAITVLLNALDGFDVMAISFASSGIRAEWGINQAQLGFVLAAELVGMGIGSILLGGVADSIGRRQTIMGCLMAMTLGMYMVTTTNSLGVLAFWRVFTGVGIGGILAAINATAAEFSSARRRHLCVSIMAIGYPLGGIFGGQAVAYLLTIYDWRSVFYFGAIVTAAMIPVCYFLVPESVFWLTRKQPEGALDKVNATLKKLGHQAVSALPVVSSEDKKKNSADVFGKTLLLTTVVVSTAYFMHILTFYFILKWVPDLVVEMGFAPSSAARVLMWASIGGATGGAIFGILTTKFDLKKLTIGAMVLGAASTAIFGQTKPDLAYLSGIVCITGIFTNGAIVGMYALFAQVFPTHARAFGTGFAVGFGRGGAVLAPIVAGFLLQGGLKLPVLAPIMALGSLTAAIILCFLKVKSGDDVVEEKESRGTGPAQEAEPQTV